MKVLILYGSNDRYGASQVLLSEIEALIELGHSVQLEVPFDGPLEEMLRARKLNVYLTTNNHMPIIRRSRPLDLLKFKYGKNLLGDADITIVWTLALALYIPLLIMNKKKFYISIHEFAQSRVLSLLVKLFVSSFRFPVQVNGKAVQNWLIAHGVQLERLIISYPFFLSENLTDRYQLTSESYGVVGRVNGKKGHLEVAIAFNTRNTSRSSTLHLFGAPFPGQENELDRLLEFIACDDRIHYHGEVEQFSEASKYFSLLLSFPLQMESLGITPIEAYYQNVRVAGYADGGSNEVFSLVDGIVIQRTTDVLRDIQDFFSVDPTLNSFPEWSPMHEQISRIFSKNQRIESVKSLIDKTIYLESKDVFIRKQCTN